MLKTAHLLNTDRNLSDSVYPKTIRILLTGNNPVEIRKLTERLEASRKIKFVFDFCFSTKDVLLKAIKFKPGFILIDDNIDNGSIIKLIEKIGNHKKARSIPVILLKASNQYLNHIRGISDFLPKNDQLCQSIIDLISPEAESGQRYLYPKYQKNGKGLKQYFNF